MNSCGLTHAQELERRSLWISRKKVGAFINFNQKYRLLGAKKNVLLTLNQFFCLAQENVSNQPFGPVLAQILALQLRQFRLKDLHGMAKGFPSVRNLIQFV